MGTRGWGVSQGGQRGLDLAGLCPPQPPAPRQPPTAPKPRAPAPASPAGGAQPHAESGSPCGAGDPLGHAPPRSPLPGPSTAQYAARSLWALGRNSSFHTSFPAAAAEPPAVPSPSPLGRPYPHPLGVSPSAGAGTARCTVHAAVHVPLAPPMAITPCPLGTVPLSPPASPVHSALIPGTMPHPLHPVGLSLLAIPVPLALPVPPCSLGPSPCQGALPTARPAKLPLPALLCASAGENPAIVPRGGPWHPSQPGPGVLLVAPAAAAQRGAWPRRSPGVEELTGRAGLPASPGRRGWEMREQQEKPGVINTVCWSCAQIAARNHKSPSHHRR